MYIRAPLPTSNTYSTHRDRMKVKDQGAETSVSRDVDEEAVGIRAFLSLEL